MADYTDSKPGLGEVFPDGKIDGTWSRTSPLITPDKLRSKHLWGLDLVSGMKSSITNERQQMDNDAIEDFILDACSTVELETGLTIFPTQLEAKFAYDPQHYKSFGYLMIPERPVASIEEFKISMSNNVDVFTVPIDWVETARLHKGQINLMPLTLMYASNGSSQAMGGFAGSSVFLSIFSTNRWTPSFWHLKYTTGFPDGMIPNVVNNLIGTTAAMDILSQLASTYARATSASLSIDAMSQSTSGPGAQIYMQRYKELEEKRGMLVSKLKAKFALRMFSTNV